MSGLVLLVAWVLHKVLGEPVDRLNPLLWFGQWASLIERYFYGDPQTSLEVRLFNGALSAIIAIAPWFVLAIWGDQFTPTALLLQVMLLYFAFGMTQLERLCERWVDHAMAGDLVGATAIAEDIVDHSLQNEDTSHLGEGVVNRVLGKSVDHLFAPIFWFLLTGLGGVILHRLVVVLDELWGYKNERYLHFGRFVAWLKRMLDWPPAVLTAWTFRILASTKLPKLAAPSEGGSALPPVRRRLLAAGAAAIASADQAAPALAADPTLAVSRLRKAFVLIYQAAALWIGVALLADLFTLAV